ncbi:hypothetical protein ANO11243_093450 [Dothideomycetidae sp. 11243]|nr:hypothetical protein ANO11243_093450 [fungal sp. No.11243]
MSCWSCNYTETSTLPVQHASPEALELQRTSLRRELLLRDRISPRRVKRKSQKSIKLRAAAKRGGSGYIEKVCAAATLVEARIGFYRATFEAFIRTEVLHAWCMPMTETPPRVTTAGRYHLVETRTVPPKTEDKEQFRQALDPDEHFVSEFIGASEEECRNWAIANRGQIDQRIGIVNCVVIDAYGGQTETLLYQRHIWETSMRWEFWGILPAIDAVWESWRTRYQDCNLASTALETMHSPNVYPAFFALRDQLTDEDGVFDADNAYRLMYTENFGRFWAYLQPDDPVYQRCKPQRREVES